MSTESPAPPPEHIATFPVPAPLTHDERHKYLVTYDVRDHKRLATLHKRLKDWGKPVQYSVFEALLTGPEVERMWTMITETIDARVDWVALYRLSRPFDEAVRHIGNYDPELPASDFIIFV
ncbi:MAG: CRISPR-associated endonuclease Cas2 [Burkholderiales bacterium]|nr:CRISPR-associated endonuclease Cas2 [Burkholderiaceae bacterium]MDW8324677.1 CRISPR-associated endonuclease Cas2 [Burkholderiales bacterium]